MGTDIRDTRQSPELCRFGSSCFQHRGHRLCVQTIEMKHSPSLILVWRVAEFEARHAKASTIEPNHLLLGLCKVVDLDLPEFVTKIPPTGMKCWKNCCGKSGGCAPFIAPLVWMPRRSAVIAPGFARTTFCPGRFGTIAPEFGRQAGFRRCGTFRPTRQQRGLSRPPALRDVACG